jgi:hypothetical protein
MFVVKTLTAEPVYKAFGNVGAAQRWAEDDAYLKHRARQCQIYRTVGGLTRRQAIAAVRLGKAERLQTVFQKLDTGGTQDTVATVLTAAPRPRGDSGGA